MFPFEPSKLAHFALFPSSLPYFFIKCGCPKDGLVLDPFCGGGTTGKACKELGRSFIGIELSPKYIQIAKKRIDNTTEYLF